MLCGVHTFLSSGRHGASPVTLYKQTKIYFIRKTQSLSAECSWVQLVWAPQHGIKASEGAGASSDVFAFWGVFRKVKGGGGSGGFPVLPRQGTDLEEAMPSLRIKDGQREEQPCQGGVRTPTVCVYSIERVHLACSEHILFAGSSWSVGVGSQVSCISEVSQ